MELSRLLDATATQRPTSVQVIVDPFQKVLLLLANGELVTSSSSNVHLTFNDLEYLARTLYESGIYEIQLIFKPGKRFGDMSNRSFGYWD